MPAPLLPFDVLLLIFAPLFDGLSGDNERTGTAYALLRVSRAWKEAAEEVYWRRVEFDLDSPRDRKGGGKAGYILSRPEVAQRVVEMRADWDRLLPQHQPLAKAAATVLSTSTTLKKIDLRLYRGHLDFNPTLYLEDTFLDPPFRHCLRSFTYHLHTPTNSFLRLVFSLRHFPVLEQLDIHAVAPRTRGYDGCPLWGVPALVPPAHSLPASPPLSTSLRSLRYSIVGLLPALEQTLQQTFSPTLTSVSFQGHISPSFWRWSTTSPPPLSPTPPLRRPRPPPRHPFARPVLPAYPTRRRSRIRQLTRRNPLPFRLSLLHPTLDDPSPPPCRLLPTSPHSYSTGGARRYCSAASTGRGRYESEGVVAVLANY